MESMSEYCVSGLLHRTIMQFHRERPTPTDHSGDGATPADHMPQGNVLLLRVIHGLEVSLPPAAVFAVNID